MSPDELERRKAQYIVKGLEGDIRNILRKISQLVNTNGPFHEEEFLGRFIEVAKCSTDIEGLVAELRVIISHLEPNTMTTQGKVHTNRQIEQMVKEVLGKKY